MFFIILVSMGLIKASQSYLGDFLSLLFPNICLSCETALNKNEEVLCFLCEHSLPKTNFLENPENPVAKLFWGRVDIQHASAFVYFHKQSKVQHLLHQLKYHGKPEVGEKLGCLFGEQLKNHRGFAEVEMIIPIPLHERKKKSRGYNQSDYFAMGLSQSMDIDWSDSILTRNINTVTQTGKSRFERWENVGAAFEITKANEIAGKHLLVVDDVVTTGATLEACAAMLLQIQDVKVSIATMAWAHH